MKKIKLVLVVAIVVSLTLATACGGNNSTSSVPPAQASDSAGGEQAATSPPAASDETWTLKFATHSMDYDKIEGFPEWIFEATGGRVTVEVYNLGDLGSATDVLEMLRNGTIDIVGNSPPQTPGEFPVLDTLQVPFMVTNPELASAVLMALKGAGYLEKELSNKTAPLFLIPTDSQVMGFRTKKVESMNDFKGMKIRVTSGIATDMVEAFGATVVAMPLPEVYNALDRGVIDGAASSPYMMVQNAMYEPLNYIMDTPTFNGSYIAIINGDLWDSFPEDIKAAFDEVTLKMQEKCTKDAVKMYGDGLDVCAENDVEVYKASEEFRNAMVESNAHIKQAFFDDLTKQGYDGAAIMKLVEDTVANFH